MRHAFTVLECERVELKTDARNQRSQEAIERLGATREGTLRKHMRTRGGFIRDSVYFSVIRDEWPRVEARLQQLLARD
jgi:RimJ/RimL family protein N-acetyltransferase